MRFPAKILIMKSIFFLANIIILGLLVSSGCKNELTSGLGLSSAVEITPADHEDHAQIITDKLLRVVNEANNYFSSYKDLRSSKVRQAITDFEKDIRQIKNEFYDLIPTEDNISRFEDILHTADAIKTRIDTYNDYTINDIVTTALTKVVNEEWGGGDEISFEVSEYSENDNYLFIFSTVNFYGQLTDAHYQASGRIEYAFDSNKFTFTPSYKNENLINYENMVGIVSTGAVIYELYNEISN